jgi:hypothetical protein
MSDDENNGSERGTPKASPTVKEHARKMLAELRAKLSAAQARFVAHPCVWRAVSWTVGNTASEQA